MTQITVSQAGTGRPVLILHGGGGPFTVAPIAAHLDVDSRAITPTLPGWNGTDLPEAVHTVRDLAALFAEYLQDNDLQDVLVIGSSLGGWLGSELALADPAGRITGLILIDAVGIEVAEHPVRDFFGLDARGIAEYSWHDANKGYRDPATIPPEQAAMQRANMGTMKSIAGGMIDPTLRGRLAAVDIPTLVIWGESDRVVTPAYGAEFAAAIPGARFEVVAEAGHLPQLEQPAATFALIDGFIATA
jgi:pimeloyl-ACP methyl ester carboxylesterase